MSDLLSNPFVWLAAVVVGLAVVAVLFFVLRSRRGSQKGEGQIRSELAALQRENQIFEAASQVPFSNSPEIIATQLATIFKEQLSMQLYKIYVGRDGDGQFQNILPREVEGLVTNDLSQAASLPSQIQGQTALNYTWAQTANTNVLAAEMGLGEGEAITLIPWRGPFGWSGLMVANPLPAPPNEILSSVREPIALLTTKLAVALELSNLQGGASANSDSSILNNFYEILLQSNEDPSTYQEILKEVTKLSGANSAALWRLDNGAMVLKMESAYGLHNAEFLPQPVGQGLAGTVLDSRTPLALEDAASDPRCLFPNEARESGVGSYLGIPLMANGKPLGVLEVHTLQPKWWDEQDLNKLEAVGRPLAKFIENQSGPGHRLQSESAYLGLSEALQLLQTPDELLDAVVEVLGHALSVSRVFVIDLTKDKTTINHEFKGANIQSGLGNTIRSAALQRIRNITSQEIRFLVTDNPTQSLIGEQLALSLDVASELAMPVKQNGQPAALLVLHQCGQPRSWNQGEIEFTERVGRQLAISLANLTKANPSSTAPSSNGVEERRAQIILNNLPDAVIGLDKEGRISFFNAKAQSWFGVTQGDTGNPATMTDGLAMTDEYFWNRVIACKENAQFEGYPKTFSKQLAQSQSDQPKPDERIPLSISVTPLKNQSGIINGFLVSIIDVRHMKSGDSEINAQITELYAEKDRVEKQLVDMKSAELQARARIEKMNSIIGSGKNVNEEIRRLEAELAYEREHFKQQETRMSQTFQQQVAINRMKNEFIVNSGGDISKSIQTIMNRVELLRSGAYGELNESQQKAVNDLIKLSRETSNNVNDLIEYGSSRSQ